MRSIGWLNEPMCAAQQECMSRFSHGLLEIFDSPPHTNFVLTKPAIYTMFLSVWRGHFVFPAQISNVRVENVAPRSAKDNIFQGSTTEGLMGDSKLASLQRPFLVHLRNGKVGPEFPSKMNTRNWIGERPMNVASFSRHVTVCVFSTIHKARTMIQKSGWSLENWHKIFASHQPFYVRPDNTERLNIMWW